MNVRDKSALKGLLAAKELEPYISHIRFPHYKNLAPGLRIDFGFPITALVGVNGTNKSSILRAIQGAPGKANLGVYWFSTSTDPIAETGARNAFIYGYHHSGTSQIVEVLKTRVKKDEDPDYWEPSRRLAGYDMAKFEKGAAGNQNTTRWDTITKPVVYIDFRQTISAFDRCFYYGTAQGASFRERKDFLRARSPHLRKAIDSGLTKHTFYNERIVNGENRLLTKEEREAASFILGRNYSEIRWIRHSFFNVAGATCVLKTPGLAYTEAFAGSGEFAVVRLVVDLLGAKQGSLILLDEPEVSLHPGAQKRLMMFLFEKVKELKHQVVLATHSPGIIRWLPPEAIKVFVFDPISGKVCLPSQSASAEEAFFFIEEPIPGKMTVIVEDELAKHIMMKAIRLGGAAFANQFEVKYFPGGSQTLWGIYLPVFSAEKRTDILVFLDGDQQPKQPLPDPDSVSKENSEKLQELLNAAAGTQIKFGVDGGPGGGNKAQIDLAVRELVKWTRKHLAYLPGKTPETFVWENMVKTAETNELDSMSDPKKRFDKLARMELGRAEFEPLSSQDILATQLRRLATISDDLSDIKSLYQRLIKAVTT